VGNYIKTTFTPHGLPLRTAQEYMKMAKSADSAPPKPPKGGPTDPKPRNPEKPYPVNIKLHLPGDKADAVDAMRSTPAWEGFTAELAEAALRLL